MHCSLSCLWRAMCTTRAANSTIVIVFNNFFKTIFLQSLILLYNPNPRLFENSPKCYLELISPQCIFSKVYSYILPYYLMKSQDIKIFSTRVYQYHQNQLVVQQQLIMDDDYFYLTIIWSTGQCNILFTGCCRHFFQYATSFPYYCIYLVCIL